jgi:hypothetical protein
MKPPSKAEQNETRGVPGIEAHHVLVTPGEPEIAAEALHALVTPGEPEIAPVPRKRP